MNPSNGSIRPPKGILKNSSRNSNSDYGLNENRTYDFSRYVSSDGSNGSGSAGGGMISAPDPFSIRLGLMGSGNAADAASSQPGLSRYKDGSSSNLLTPIAGDSGPGRVVPQSWDPVFCAIQPFEIIQSPPPKTPVTSNTKKLETVLNVTRSLLFKPLEVNEKPLLESREEERKSEGNYGVAPPMETFLFEEPYERIAKFFESAESGDIVIGEYKDETPQGLILSLICCDGGKRAYLEDLDIQGFIPHMHVHPRLDYSSSSSDYVRCEVLEVVKDQRKLVLGTKGCTLTPDMILSFPLGIITKEELPRQYTVLRDVMRSRRKKQYEDILQDSLGFRNPNCTACVGFAQGLFCNRHTLTAGLSNAFPKKDMANEIRSAQNAKWAQYNVTLGVRHFKQGNQVEAFQCLNKAIMIDPNNVEGLVARGALYGNKGTYDKALEDLELALKVNPDHFNGKKYMAEILFVVGKGHLENTKFDEAIIAYNKMLDVIPDHKEALYSLMSVHEQLEGVDTMKLTASGVSKLLTLKEKLNGMLAQEFAKKRLGYYERSSITLKDLHKRAAMNSSDSESSFSSSSRSDSGGPSIDDSSRGKRKKKAKKRSKKRKSRNEKKDDSLSPLSKKLASYKSNLAGALSSWRSEPSSLSRNDGESARSRKRSRDRKKSKKSKDKEKRRKKRRDSSMSSESEDDAPRRVPREEVDLEVDFFQMETELAARFAEDEHQRNRLPPSNTTGNVSGAVPFAFDPTRRYTTFPSIEHSTFAAPLPQVLSRPPMDYGSVNPSQTIMRTIQNDALSTSTRAAPIVLNPPLATSMSTAPMDGVIKVAAKIETLSKFSIDGTKPNPPISKWRALGSAIEDDSKPTLTSLPTPEAAAPSRPEVKSSQGILNPSSSVAGRFDQPHTAPKNEPRYNVQEPVVKKTVMGRSRSRSPTMSKSRGHSSSESPRKSPDQRSRRYRSRSKSRSPARRSRRRYRSRSRSNSRSRSVSKSRYRSRSRSRTRSRSHGRRRSRSYSRSSSRSRSRSRSNDRSKSFRQYGRGRFNANSNRGQKPVRVYQGKFTGYTGSATSYRGRNRFVGKSRSRSRSRSNDRGEQRFGNRRSEGPSATGSTLTNKTEGGSDWLNGKSNTFHVKRIAGSTSDYLESGKLECRSFGSGSGKVIDVSGKLLSSSVAVVEALLDERMAYRKEEIREQNPEFFRKP